MKKIISSIVFAAVALNASAQDYVFNRYPLEATDFAELPIGAIKADGWLHEQLVKQKDGMTGHLDELYSEVVGEDNAWIGGEGDTWERGPYWIDGLVPLAHLLDDEELIVKANKWVEAMITTSADDGYFGNRISRPYIEGFQRGKAEDWWPKMVALKILKQHYMATGDERVITVMTKYFRYQLENLPEKPLDHWTFWENGVEVTISIWYIGSTTSQGTISCSNSET